MKPREKLWCLTLGGFLAGGVCMFIPVGWTTMHSTTVLRITAWLELGVGVFGLVALALTRRSS